MKKIHGLILTAVLALICVFAGAVSTGAAFASDDDLQASYQVLFPNLTNYLYLNNPVIGAVDGDTAAVYDLDSSKIFVAGDTQASYEVSLQSFESIISLGFTGGKLYYLTNRSRLFNVTDGTEIQIGLRDFTMMTQSNGKLYFYNGTRFIYEYNGLSFTDYADDERLFLGGTGFAVIGNTAAMLNGDEVIMFDLSQNKVTSRIPSGGAQRIIAVNGMLLLISDGITVVAAGSDNDELTYQEAFPDATTIINISTDGERLAVLSGDDKALYIYSPAEDGFTLSNMYGCASDSDGWYNSPQSVVNTTEGTFAVWDKNNARIQVVNTLNDSHFYVTYDSENYLAFTAGGNTGVLGGGATLNVFPLTAGEATMRQIQTPFDIGAVALAGNRIYVFDRLTSMLYSADISADVPVFSLFALSAREITHLYAVGNGNDVLYGVSDDGLYLYTKGGRLDARISSATGAFAVDYVGNVFLAKATDGQTKIVKYTRTVLGLAEDSAVTLTGDFKIEGLNSLAIDCASDTLLALDLTKNALIKTEISAVINSSEYIASTSPALAEISPDNISYVKTTTGGTVYATIDNFNNIVHIAPVGRVLIAVDGLGDDNFHCVITEDGKVGYLPKAQASTAVESTESGTVIALHEWVNVYNIPSASGTYTRFDKSQLFTLVSDCAQLNDGNAWYKISYSAGGVTEYGYLMKMRVMSYTQVPEIEEPIYAKAKAERIGTKVNIYAMADETSAVVASLTDGESVKLLTDYDEGAQFTMVEYNGNVGFVLTSQLQLDKGLTNGQIVAIVLASVTVVITCVYFFISRRNKRLQNK